ncbi:MAG: hypothetical protein GOVbin52_48 [Prokaryotic dsDNA virus sp.]|nr:MAG: hypothetical protein GOVbin52_48 [Prokaryotic dsDNA virus sp.]|tara:strand:+ start:14438 stop:15370 length:933 start_codon:yes stop_codon:yes gene_type:complete
MTDDTTVLDKTDDAVVEDTKTTEDVVVEDKSADTAEATDTTDDKSTDTDSAWYESAARGDEKRAERLKRFTDPGALFDSYTELEKQLSDQKRVRIPDDDAKPEDLEVWKRMAGIPETADGYKIDVKLPEGESFDDSDKELLDTYTQKLHESGGLMAHPKVVAGLHQIYADMRADAAAQLMANAKAKHEETQATLDKEWGAEKERNIGFANSTLQRYGGEGTKELLKTPMADGTLLGDHPPLVRMLAQIGREVGDDPIFTEAASKGDPIETLEARKDKILALRREGKHKEYDAKAEDLARINAALKRHGKS